MTNLFGKKIHLFGDFPNGQFPPELLNKIIEKGCQYLALDWCSVEKKEVEFKRNFTLKYLSLNRCGDTEVKFYQTFPIFPDFAASCHGLEKFYVKSKYDTIEPFEEIIDSKFIKCIIQSSGTLSVLNLADISTALELESLQIIFRLCRELKELNVNGDGLAGLCGLDEDSIDFLVKNLTTKIEKLDISFQEYFGDKHLKILVERCNKLTELKVGGYNNVTDESVDVIVENLSNTLVKIHTWFEFPAIKKLFAMPHLKVLVGRPKILQEDWQVQTLRKLKPHLNFIRAEDYISQADFRIAEPYDDFDETEDSRRGFTANKFWEIEAEKQTYNVYQI